MIQGFKFAANFAGFDIDVLSSAIRHGRTVVAHTFPNRDGANTEDLGRDPREISIDFVLMTKPNEDEDSYLNRFESFDQIMRDGSTRTLRHPYVGALRCKVSSFEHNSNGDIQPFINCSATFIEEVSEAPVRDSEDGLLAESGIQEVSNAQIAADEALATAGLSSTLTGEITDAAENWDRNPNLTSRQVQMEMASLNNRLNNELQTIQSATDISKHPIAKQYTLLQYNLRKAASRFSTPSPRIVEITVTEPLPMLIIASRFYGPEDAQGRLGELADLNPAIRDLQLVPAGTVVKAFSAVQKSSRDFS